MNMRLLIDQIGIYEQVDCRVAGRNESHTAWTTSVSGHTSSCKYVSYHKGRHDNIQTYLCTYFAAYGIKLTKRPAMSEFMLTFILAKEEKKRGVLPNLKKKKSNGPCWYVPAAAY